MIGKQPQGARSASPPTARSVPDRPCTSVSVGPRSPLPHRACQLAEPSSASHTRSGSGPYNSLHVLGVGLRGPRDPQAQVLDVLPRGAPGGGVGKAPPPVGWIRFRGTPIAARRPRPRGDRGGERLASPRGARLSHALDRARRCASDDLRRPRAARRLLAGTLRRLEVRGVEPGPRLYAGCGVGGPPARRWGRRPADAQRPACANSRAFSTRPVVPARSRGL